MNTYILRSLKYILRMIILLGVIFTAMIFTKTSVVSGDELFAEVFLSQRGMLLMAVIVIVAGFYPRIGFVKRDIKANLDESRTKIIEQFAAIGYAPIEQNQNKIVFRQTSMIKRIIAMGDDPIEVKADDNYISISGIRKDVVRLEFKLKAYLEAE